MRSPHTRYAAGMAARWYQETWRSGLTAAAVVIPGALVLGGLTSFAQTYLPPALTSFANSAGGWTMLCFALVWLSRARPLLGAVLGLAAFLLLVEGYGLVSAWRGYFYAAPFSTLWTLVSFLAGPLVGAAAAICRHGRPLWRVLAVTPLSAILLGEGVWGLLTVAATTTPVYWSIEIVLSVLFLAIAVARVRPPLRGALLVAGVWLVGAGAYFGVWFGFTAVYAGFAGVA